jgi:3-dehydroshikimate dehydratase
MFTISAFADEISPDPQEQIDVLTRCGVRCIELRSVHQTNVLDLTDLQVKEFKSLLDRHGFRLSAIGSPIGKVRVDAPFEPHLQRFKRAVELCKVFDTPNIRVFSYYPPGDAEDWNGVSDSWEHELFRRLEEQMRLASRAGVRLVHENEHRIYGDSPERVSRLFEVLQSDAFRAVYDAANYVFCGYDPWEGWEKTRQYTAHFHIKDWVAGEKHGRLAGEGQGRIPEVIADAHARGYDGFAVLEPHLLGGGPTGGHTGPELFPKAVAAFKGILDRAGAKYQ